MGINITAQNYTGHHSLAWSTQIRHTKLDLFRKCCAHSNLHVSYWLHPSSRMGSYIHVYPLNFTDRGIQKSKITSSYKIWVTKLTIVIHWGQNFHRIFWSKVLSKYPSSSQTLLLLESFYFREFRMNHGMGLPCKTSSASDFTDPDEKPPKASWINWALKKTKIKN